VAELLPTIQTLSRDEKVHLFRLLEDELAKERRDLWPIPEGFPPPEDGCPSTREELERLRRMPGIYTTEEVLRSLGEP
jgi:hypothetical protein